MNDWTHGYRADIDYTHGYYAELNPLRMRYALLNAGFVAPDVTHACELGYGQGISVNLHAAASNVAWWGTDFNPSQASFAQSLSTASGAQAQLADQGFEHYCHRTDLPDFDYIGIHGIWSWVSDAHRNVMVDFIRRKLKVGGVLYISYNMQPGWAAVQPLRDILTQHALTQSPSGLGTADKIKAALQFAAKLGSANASYFQQNPNAERALSDLTSANPSYLAHEYFNRDWEPMHFSRIAASLSAAKLSYATSANYHDQLDHLQLSLDQQALLRDLPDPVFAQTTRDFITNRRFRADYWIKGPRKHPGHALLQARRNQRVVMLSPREDILLKMNTPLGEVQMLEQVCTPVIELLSDHQVHTLEELETALASQQIPLPQIAEVLTILLGNATIAPASESTSTRAAKPCTDKLNAHLLELARSSTESTYLASPITGGGIHMPHVEQLFVHASRAHPHDPAAWASYAWAEFQAMGSRLVKNGQVLAQDQDNQDELHLLAQAFHTKRLPLLSQLQVV